VRVRVCVCVSVVGCVWVHELGRVLVYLSSMLRADAILSASSLAPPNLSTLPHKRHGVQKKVTEHKMCV
jgi:hypothetical protein